ncbi:MAG TPA: glycosyltransferase family 39 protein [Patescibacteria group bacterium]|nr:glycosyltransferase family 39 protein [Patescibacteria group bacterium]
MITRFFFLCFFILIAIYSVGIFLPETGFDALWYHLPIIKNIAIIGHPTYIPDLYQSLQPMLGEILLAPLYKVAGVAGAKLGTFLFSLCIPLLVYQIAKKYLNKFPSLLVALVVFSFHTVAWQSASVYVDSIRTVFELYVLLCILEKKYIRVGVFLGLALLTKSVALLFFPSFIVFSYFKLRLKKTAVICGIALLLFLPSQIWGYTVSGQVPLLAIFSQTSKDLIGANYIGWFLRQSLQFVLTPILLSFHRESYTTPVFVIAVPFLIAAAYKNFKAETWYITASLWTWQLILPVSVRYDEAGIVVLLILSTWAVWNFPQGGKVFRCLFVVVAFLGISANIVLRLGVVYRAMSYLTGKETEMQYVDRFRDGVNTGPIDQWYKEKPPQLPGAVL